MSEYANLSPSLAARMALTKYGFHFTHSLGQNFLLDDGLIGAMLESARVEPGDRVLEIGPGAGVMTRHLLEMGARVTAVELDKGLEPVLNAVLENLPDVRVIFGDAMKLDLGEVMEGEGYRVVANLPYYITADLIQKLLTQRHKPRRVTVMVQKEAAERMMAPVGGKTWCTLAATVQYFGAPRMLMEVGPEAFTPRPHVMSALMDIDIFTEKPVQARSDAMMLKVISACFAMRRKTLLNNLCSAFSVPREQAALWLEDSGLSPMVRGEALPLGELARLSDRVLQDLPDR